MPSICLTPSDLDVCGDTAGARACVRTCVRFCFYGLCVLFFFLSCVSRAECWVECGVGVGWQRAPGFTEDLIIFFVPIKMARQYSMLCRRCVWYECLLPFSLTSVLSDNGWQLACWAFHERAHPRVSQRPSSVGRLVLFSPSLSLNFFIASCPSFFHRYFL